MNTLYRKSLYFLGILLYIHFNVFHFTTVAFAQNHVELAEGFRQKLIQQLLDIESIECDYIYSVTKEGTTLPPEMFRFKNKGELIWYEIIKDTNNYEYVDDPTPLTIETNVSGAFDIFYVKDNGQRIHQTNLKHFYAMHYDQLSPLTMRGISSPFTCYTSTFSFKDNLQEYLQRGTDLFLEREDSFNKLSIFYEPKDYNYKQMKSYSGIAVYFDDDMLICQIDYFLRPMCSFTEISLYSGEIEPHKVFYLRNTDFFEEFVQIDGFNIPTKLRRIWWRVDWQTEQQEILSGYYKMHEQNLMGACELEVRTELLVPGYIVTQISEVKIDPSTCRINNPTLTREDFEIKPGEVDIFWDKESGDFIEQGEAGNWFELKKETERRSHIPFYRRDGNFILLVSTVIFLGSVSLLLFALIARKRL